MILLYLDPGIGSALIQGLIAGTIGFFYGIKIYGNKIKSFFIRKKDQKQNK
jgi:hypothetical protein